MSSAWTQQNKRHRKINEVENTVHLLNSREKKTDEKRKQTQATGTMAT